MREILLPMGLVALGLVFIGIEVFIPSAGILGILAAISLGAGVVLAFYYGGIVTGTAFLVTTSTAVAVLVYQLIRWWPHTRIGKSILIEPDKEVVPIDRSDLSDLIGRVGKSMGTMMPGGYVEVDGKRYDAIAEVAIDDDQWITVTGLGAGRTLRVQAISADEAMAALKAESDPLSRPAKEFVDDPFMDPNESTQ